MSTAHVHFFVLFCLVINDDDDATTANNNNNLYCYPFYSWLCNCLIQLIKQWKCLYFKILINGFYCCCFFFITIIQARVESLVVEGSPIIFCIQTPLHPSLSTFLLRVQHHCYLYHFCTVYANGDILTQELPYEEARRTTLHNGVSPAVEDF